MDGIYTILMSDGGLNEGGPYTLTLERLLRLPLDCPCILRARQVLAAPVAFRLAEKGIDDPVGQGAGKRTGREVR